jgi:Thymidylate synthase
MKVINAINVNDALVKGSLLLTDQGVITPSRNGNTLDAGSVTTVYAQPRQQILWLPQRKSNHMFHFIDAMWCLAGRFDLEPMMFFNKRYAEYSDDGRVLYGAYGPRLHDQFLKALDLLEREPYTRRAAMTILRPADIGAETKDMPCNTTVYLRTVHNKLNISVSNRSNDIVWGLYGANYVQFSFFLIAAAESLGVLGATVTDSLEQDRYAADAELRLSTTKRMFSCVGNSASDRWKNSVVALNKAFDDCLSGDIYRWSTGPNLTRSSALISLAFTVYDYLKKRLPTSALLAIDTFVNIHGKCQWTEAFKAQCVDRLPEQANAK